VAGDEAIKWEGAVGLRDPLRDGAFAQAVARIAEDEGDGVADAVFAAISADAVSSFYDNMRDLAGLRTAAKAARAVATKRPLLVPRSWVPRLAPPPEAVLAELELSRRLHGGSQDTDDDEEGDSEMRPGPGRRRGVGRGRRRGGEDDEDEGGGEGFVGTGNWNYMLDGQMLLETGAGGEQLDGGKDAFVHQRDASLLMALSSRSHSDVEINQTGPVLRRLPTMEMDVDLRGDEALRSVQLLATDDAAQATPRERHPLVASHGGAVDIPDDDDAGDWGLEMSFGGFAVAAARGVKQ
jgi:hypothetical protein